MKPYVLSLTAGLLVGAVYGLIHVRSPAPPVIALIGLLGILAGEQIPPLVRHIASPRSSALTWFRHQVRPHILGRLPQGDLGGARTTDSAREATP
jgi:XapX domain-containing protein